MSVTRWRGALPRAVALALAAALTPVPAFASNGAAAANGKSPAVSLQAAAAREVANMTARRTAVRHDEQTSSGTREGGFLRSGPGIVAIAVLAAGAGYAIYSSRHDRVSSPGRK